MRTNDNRIHPSIAFVNPIPDLLAEPQFSTQNCGRQGKPIPSNAFAERVSEANEGFLGATPLSPFSCERSLSGDKECEILTPTKCKENNKISVSNNQRAARRKVFAKLFSKSVKNINAN